MRRLQRHFRCGVAEISVRAPPITPASATGPRSSAITRSSVDSARSTPSRVSSRSPCVARRIDDGALQLRRVERVQRLADPEQDEVGDVDDARDGPHPGRDEPRLVGERRGRGGDEGRAVHPAQHVMAAADGVLDPHLTRGRHGRRERDVGRVVQFQAEGRRQFPRNPPMRQGITAVGRHLDVEHRIGPADQRLHVSPERGIRPAAP